MADAGSPPTVRDRERLRKTIGQVIKKDLEVNNLSVNLISYKTL